MMNLCKDLFNEIPIHDELFHIDVNFPTKSTLLERALLLPFQLHGRDSIGCLVNTSRSVGKEGFSVDIVFLGTFN